MSRRIKYAPNGELIEEEESLVQDPHAGVLGSYHDPDDDQVNHPSHYQSYVAELNIEAIDCMRAAFGDKDVSAFCLCNSLKYIYRCKSKGGNESIEKAIWYLNKYLELNKQ